MKKIAFIGAGSMAEAVFAGLVNTNYIPSENIFVSNRENTARLSALHEQYGITGMIDKAAVIKDAAVVFLATKPHDLEKVAETIKDYIQENQLIISVIAGKSTSYIQDLLQVKAPIIRSMPNTSATIGMSATAITKGAYATDEHITIAKDIFSAIGTVSVVEEEEMHIVTAISGSGPAYIYYFVEAMEAAAKQSGLDEKVAKDLITQTIIGAGNMLQQSDTPAAILRKNVTSPNGTTAAGLEALSHHGFQEAIIACVNSAKGRSRELGSDD